jgi:bifunctional DNase/RNase
LQKMSIGTVLFDQTKGAAIVTLVEDTGERVVPIFIGLWEGAAILRELQRTPAHRPLLHDVFFNVMYGLQVGLEKIVVDALSDNTFFAQLHLKQHDSVMIADARPSDAIALALKFQAPIYVAEAVLEAAGRQRDSGMMDKRQTASTPSEDVQAWLENIRPEDFADPQ